jgi:hypothetical protein
VRGRPFLFWLDVAVKAALVGLLLFAVVRPDLPQFEGKAFTARALVYPWSVLVVPLGWPLPGAGAGVPFRTRTRWTFSSSFRS